MDPLANAYLKIVNESVAELQSSGTVKTDLKIGQSFGHDDKNATTFQKNTGPEDSEGTEDVENPKEAEGHLTASKQNDGTPKKLNDSVNPFDTLFNKIISEEGIMDFSTDTENPEDSTFEPSESEESDEFGETEGEESEESEDQVSFTLDREVAEALYSVLGDILGGESEEEYEGEESEGEEDENAFGDSEEGEEEESQSGAMPFGEATDMSELSTEKGKTLIGKKKMTVQGAVPVTKKKAVTPSTGKGFSGKLTAHSTSGAISKLQSKKQLVGSVDKVGKSHFDQD